MILHVYADPGHAWAKISRKKLDELGLTHKISSYSYQRGDFVYVEEDGDMHALHKAVTARGETLEYRTHTADKRSKIRGYASYQPTEGTP